MPPRKRREPFADVNSLNKKIYGGPPRVGQYVGFTASYDLEKAVPYNVGDAELYEDPLSMIKKPDSDVETAESESPAEPVSEEYRILGLTWYTPEFVNTCHIDSFLSAFCRRMRQTHGKFLKNIKYKDAVGDVLIKIAEHALNAKNLIDASYVKKMWLEVASNVPLKTPFDASGLEQFSIFQHLTNHSRICLESWCDCGPQYELELEGFDLRSINFVLQNRRGHNELMAVCERCNKQRRFQKMLPGITSWILPIKYKGQDSPPFKDIIPELQYDDKKFKVAYLSYKISASVTGHNVGHVISVQNIRGSWYKYDGLKSPSFVLCKDQKYMSDPNATLQYIVYFIE